MKISNSKDLALAIVASSSPALSIEDKIKLYEDAYEAVEAHNKPIIEAENERRAKDVEAFLDTFGR
ncbi:hypothetical protein [Streptococcus agalactiae]|uniref:hypothetical protein n=1 Tax=Streptococcus agalactiae TaxID=1311 RepID=UPI000332E8CB|nr:hypothetical protein [Streptococcus agalactiae]QBX20665.1 hypothetical protein Javan53_0006 [Streptococcus phage Javan53]CCW39574.1 hypothetical protein MSA_7130 [Streptococcus agalactiae ILRI005]